MNPWFAFLVAYLTVGVAFLLALCRAAAEGDRQLEALHRHCTRRHHHTPRRYCTGRAVGRYQR